MLISLTGKAQYVAKFLVDIKAITALEEIVDLKQKHEYTVVYHLSGATKVKETADEIQDIISKTLKESYNG
jgi:hypothetical protein